MANLDKVLYTARAHSTGGREGVSRSDDGKLDITLTAPGGKGVNVSWALHRSGVPTRTVFPAGGQTGKAMEDALTAAGLPYRVIDTDTEVRTNITLISPGHSTKLNEPGAGLDDDDIEQLYRDGVLVRDPLLGTAATAHEKTEA